MNKLLNRSWILLAAMLVLPFVLLAAKNIAGWLQGGGAVSFLFLLLWILSIYVALGASILTFGCGMLFWLLAIVDFKRGNLLLLVLFAFANIVASILWMRLFLRHIHLRY